LAPAVIDLTTGDSVDLKRDPITKAVSFPIKSGHDYEMTIRGNASDENHE
jgi:hypothetical protein